MRRSHPPPATCRRAGRPLAAQTGNYDRPEAELGGGGVWGGRSSRASALAYPLRRLSHAHQQWRLHRQNVAGEPIVGFAVRQDAQRPRAAGGAPAGARRPQRVGDRAQSRHRDGGHAATACSRGIAPPEVGDARRARPAGRVVVPSRRPIWLPSGCLLHGRVHQSILGWVRNARMGQWQACRPSVARRAARCGRRYPPDAYGAVNLPPGSPPTCCRVCCCIWL